MAKIVEKVKDFFRDKAKDDISLSDKDELLVEKLDLRIDEAEAIRKPKQNELR